MRNVLLSVGLVLGWFVAAGPAHAKDVKCHPYLIKLPHSQAAVSTSWRVSSLCAAYNFPTKLSASGVIGILELGGGWVQSDLDGFSALNGLPKIQVTNVSVNGGVNNPGVDGNADGEVTLDIQMAAAAYYYATGKMPTIYVFFAPNATASFVATIQAALTAKCDVLSISWGNDEKSWQAAQVGAAAQVEAAAATASAAGLTIFAAAGDSSSSDGDTGTNVDVPASCPHIIGCGGTNKTATTETVWGDGIGTDDGTGGGYSSIFPAQSFQIGAPTAPTGLGRMVPDISAVADPNTGVRFYVQGSEQVIGGTSIVAPFYAGLFAAIGKQLGFITPTLWSNRTAFTDITSGSNGAYHATVGPDACTGIGVPKGATIAALFIKKVTAIPVTSHVQVVYTPGTKTLSLTGDASRNSLTITLAGTQLRVEGANGTAINGSSTYTVTHSGSLILTSNLGDGDDSLSMIGLGMSTANLQMGSGSDVVAFTLCSISSLTIDGGAGTDVLLKTASTIQTLHETNVP